MPRSISRSCNDCEVRESGGFCSLGDAALARLGDLGDSMLVPAGTQILREGFEADKVFVVCSGQVKLTVTSRDGRVLILRIAGPGDMLGMAAALKQSQYESTAEALEPTELKVMPRVEFLRFMEEFQEVGQNSARTIAAEYQSAVLSARRVALSGSAAGKLASVLVEWAHRVSPAGSALRFTMSLTHEELANMAGLSRETVTRLLGRFKGEGWIRVAGSTIEIVDEVGMERLFS